MEIGNEYKNATWYNEEMQLFWSYVISDKRPAMIELLANKRIYFNPFQHYYNRMRCIIEFRKGYDAFSMHLELKLPYTTVKDYYDEWLAHYM